MIGKWIVVGSNLGFQSFYFFSGDLQVLGKFRTGVVIIRCNIHGEWIHHSLYRRYGVITLFSGENRWLLNGELDAAFDNARFDGVAG